MILGIGVDMVRVERFGSWVSDPAKIKRFFGQNEMNYCLAQGSGAAASLAARFAAKEAFGKAIGTGLAGMRLGDIQVFREDGREPSLVLNKDAKRVFSEICRSRGFESSDTALHLSLTHEKDHALAFVVFEKK